MNRAERERQYVSAIERATAKSLRVSTAEAVEVFDACAIQVLSRVDSPAEALELRRRIAEAKISVLFERHDALVEFSKAWAELESLGYSSNEREASMLVYALKVRQDEGQTFPFDRAALLFRLDKNISEMRREGAGSVAIADHFLMVRRSLL